MGPWENEESYLSYAAEEKERKKRERGRERENKQTDTEIGEKKDRGEGSSRIQKVQHEVRNEKEAVPGSRFNRFGFKSSFSSCVILQVSY